MALQYDRTLVKKRDFLFDNYKALLILLVVTGHFLDLNYKNNTFLYTLKWLIVSFHMPAFIFISGYFSKKEMPAGKIIKTLAVPYVVYECIYYLLYVFILDKQTGLSLIYPKFSLWYILALFVWRIITPAFQKLPFHMVISIAAGLLIGCSGMKDNFLSLPRIIVFYPFFLAGLAFNRDLIDKYRNTCTKILAALTVALFTLYLILDPAHKEYSPKIFYGRYNYDFLDQDIPEGVLIRLFCYVIGFTMTFAVAFLIADRRTFFSYLGTRTMAVYLFHGLLYSYLKHSSKLLQQINTIPESVLLLCFCIGLVFLFSWKPLTNFTNQIANFKYQLPTTYYQTYIKTPKPL